MLFAFNPTVALLLWLSVLHTAVTHAAIHTAATHAAIHTAVTHAAILI